MAIALTVDVILFAEQHDLLHVLLVQRKNPPFEGAWALPGGFVEEGEDLEPAARRELAEETGIMLPDDLLFQFGAFGAPGRDPRGHTVTVAYFGYLPSGPAVARGGDDAVAARWWPLDELPELAFDHAEILEEAYAVMVGEQE